MKTEFNCVEVPERGEVVVLQIAPDCELQLFWQKAATPEFPTAQRFPPDVAKVTELRFCSGVTWLIGSLVQTGAESSEVPWTMVGGAPGESASPTAHPSEELRRTIDRSVALHPPGEYGPDQTPFRSRMMVQDAPTAHPLF